MAHPFRHPLTTISFSENIRYLAPERLEFLNDLSSRESDDYYNSASKESDVYSLAMTSFTVRSSIVNQTNT